MSEINNVQRILVDTKAPVDNIFDSCVIETDMGDVYAFICSECVGKPNYYNVTIYNTVVFIHDISEYQEDGDDEIDCGDEIDRVIDITQPLYSQSFFASTPMYKRGVLSDMLDCIKNDDANTWNKLKEKFGYESNAIHVTSGEAGFC